MPAPARLLDLTRLTSRLGQGQPTGVDRVEAAYLAQFLTLDRPVFGLVKTKLGFLFLDRQGMQAFQHLILAHAPLPSADFLSRLTRGKTNLLARAETAVRALACARCRPSQLPQMLRKNVPLGFVYFNTGHANLNAKTLQAVRAGGAASLAVLVHDTIPLDHPEFTRPDTISGFDAKIAAVAAHADLVIHTAKATRTQTERHFGRHGRIPQGLVAHLGITALQPGSVALRTHPYFVALGTIEPRKNHAFLLDIWDAMHRELPLEDIPHLLILGRRGWSNEPVFQRLDSLPFRNQTVFEMPNLPDETVATVLAHSQALLFPSFVEGFGLPPLEAAGLGVAVIVPPLAIYRETLGDYPVYAGLEDSYSWMEAIIRMSGEKSGQAQVGQKQVSGVHIPQWDAHFKTVLNFPN